jgi:hypothetical protein
MEEHRHYWAPLVRGAVKQIIEGKAVLVVTDEEYKWFGKYILNQINQLEKNRPFLPFFQLVDSFPRLSELTTTHDVELLEDMLEISYPNGYLIWYVGKGNHPYTKVAMRSDDNFLWMMDEEVQNSFHLRTADALLDIKLLQMYKLFDQTLSALLFGDLDLEP